MSTIQIPITGWFADGSKFDYTVGPPPDGISLDTPVTRIGWIESRPLLSYLVETLAGVRENGRACHDGTGATEWLEWGGYIKAAEARADIFDRWINEIRYGITEKGIGFLAVHEAPAEW